MTKVRTGGVSLTKAWVERWPDADSRRSMIAEMRAAGLSQHEAHQWLAAPLVGYLPDVLVETAIEWAGAGFDTQTAIAWASEQYYDPPEAWKWHREGYSPSEATFVNQMIQFGPRRLTFDECMRHEVMWRSSGLPVSWVCLVLALGLDDVREARRLHAQAERDPELEPALRTAAQARGVSTRALRISDWEKLWASLA